MYGQDFGIITTNANAKVINNYTSYSGGQKLLNNVLIISSPTNSDTNIDVKKPALFVTDYNGDPMQLTYSFKFGNGLNLDDNDYNTISMNIDDKTIKTNIDNQLYVDSTQLDIIGNNTLGLAKIETSIQRDSGDLPNDTFISSDNGTLFLNNKFFEYLDNYITQRINLAIRPLISTNLSGYLKYNEVEYHNGESITINANTISDIITLPLDIYYRSTSDSSETILIRPNSANISYPILYNDNEIITTIENSIEIGDQTLYTHKASTSISFYPNLKMNSSGESYPINYMINLIPDSWQSDGNQMLLNIYQQKIEDISTIELNNQRISIDTMVKYVTRESLDNPYIEFYITNNFNRLFDKLYFSNLYNDDIKFSLSLLYGNDRRVLWSSDNDNTIDINDLIIDQSSFKINVDITKSWLDTLVELDNSNNYISQNNVYKRKSSTSNNYYLQLKIFIKNTEVTVYTSQTNIDYDYTKYNIERIGNTADKIKLTHINNLNQSLDTLLEASMDINTGIYTIIINSHELFNRLFSTTGNNGNVSFNINYRIPLTANTSIKSFGPDDIRSIVSSFSSNSIITYNETNIITEDEVKMIEIPIIFTESNITDLYGYLTNNKLKFTIESNKFISNKTVELEFDFISYILNKINVYTYINDTITSIEYINGYYSLVNSANIEIGISNLLSNITLNSCYLNNTLQTVLTNPNRPEYPYLEVKESNSNNYVIPLTIDSNNSSVNLIFNIGNMDINISLPFRIN